MKPRPATPTAHNVTGRIASITLPTGGTITYTYSGGSNGITCGDGSTATLTRQTPDGTWTYAHTESGPSWSTIVTDPQSNQTHYNFQGVYETEHLVYQGSNVLGAVYTCYDGATAPCNGTAITLPITQINVTTALGTEESETETYYNSTGLVTKIDAYDFGSGS